MYLERKLPEIVFRTVAEHKALTMVRPGIVKLTDCRLFSAFFHEAKPLKLRKAAIDNLPRFWSESS